MLCLFMVYTNVRNKLNLQQFYVILFGCRAWIGILREKQQIGGLRVTGAEGDTNIGHTKIILLDVSYWLQRINTLRSGDADLRF